MEANYDCHLLNPYLADNVSQFYKVLSDPTRMQIVYLLQQKELKVGRIAEIMDMEQSAISHQLRSLKLHRLVKSRRDGKEIYYSLDDEHVIDILNQTIQHIEHTR